MFTPLVFGIALPAVISGFFLFLGWLWRRNLTDGVWSGALACAIGAMAGFFGILDWSGFPPRLAEGWLPFIAGVAGIAGLLECLVLKKTVPRIFIGFLLVAAAIWVLIASQRSSWSTLGFAALYAGLCAATLLVLASLDILASRRPGLSIPLCLWVWTAGIAGSLALTGSLRYGELAGVLAATMGAGIVAAFLNSNISFARGAVPVLAPLAIGLVICGYFYSELPISSAPILALSPMILWVGESKFATGRRPWIGALMRAGLIALPVGIALILAAWPMLFPKSSPKGPGNVPSEEYY